MKHQALRPIALMLSVLLIAAVPAKAGTIEFGDVIALATVNGQSGRQTVDLRLRSVTQTRGASSQGGQQQTAPGDSQDPKNTQTPSGATAAPTGTDSNLTGTVVPQQSGNVQVETIELGDVQGTICDCGEIFIPKAGFPLWPLIGLAAVPLIFIPHDNDTPPPPDVTPTPTPTTTPTPEVPEPATLLLLGTGLAALGAGARRRRAARNTEQNVEAFGAGEV